MDLQNTTALKSVASNLITQYGAEVEELAKNIDPSHWATESFEIAKNTTYPRMQATNTADEEYTQLVYETSKKRITLAGYRLANFVIDIYEQSTQDQEKPSDLELVKQFAEHSKASQ